MRNPQDEALNWIGEDMQISWQEQFSDRVIHDADNWQDLFVGFPIYMSTLAANYKKDATMLYNIYDVLICFRQFAKQCSYATKWQTKAKLLRMTTQRWHTYTHHMFSYAVITSLQQRSPESGEFRVLRKIVRIIPPNVDGWLFSMVRHFCKQFSCRSDRKTAKFSLIDWQRCFGLCQWTEQLTTDSNIFEYDFQLARLSGMVILEVLWLKQSRSCVDFTEFAQGYWCIIGCRAEECDRICWFSRKAFV